ncbi:CD59 glycoprotein isoform X1 [Pan troglodytes]|uniref:CD59 glycoprotein n=1 Tax=Pan troglodytes TaxID=9598 RepID=G2HDS7_PANTR|nr:CD59 glycoprotein precursor [Pan troglodytes]XP_009458434.1 CD59 glycoprotein isoform X1 [Pan troglodytes]XP_054517154.1 CD59 glycoprotein isoform X1 [Pan troglodytes]XP_054517155.1 CD59 glycoprotein isoform X1 [Pan troglodytes]BAK64047.1 CD59 glycoprotein precursor [Pan troglodytes]
MGIQGGSVLFGLLLVLAVFCHSGHSLQCYNCPNPTADCKTAVNCSSDFDACLITKAGLQVYNKCWKLEHCNFKDLTTRLRENELTYYCCKKDLCNFNEQLENGGNEQLENGGNEQLENGGTSLSEKTVLLRVTPFLAAAWSLHP